MIIVTNSRILTKISVPSALPLFKRCVHLMTSSGNLKCHQNLNAMENPPAPSRLLLPTVVVKGIRKKDARWEFPSQCLNSFWAYCGRNWVCGALFCWYCIDTTCDASFLPLASWQMMYARLNSCKGPRKIPPPGLQLYLKICEMILSGAPILGQCISNQGI